MIDKEKYLRDLQGVVQAAQQQHEQGLSAFRTAATREAAEAALEQTSLLTEEDDVRKAMQFFRDKQATPRLRALALARALNGLSDAPEFIQDCLTVLADPTEPAGLRANVFAGLSALSFSSKTFVALRSEYMGLLRTLLDDPEDSIRALAAGELAKRKDGFVQRKLLDGLSGRSPLIVSEAKAVQLLGYDIHAEHFPIVRELLQRAATDDVTKLEAIHVLASDPLAKPLLLKLWQDKSQDKEIRMSSAGALQSSDPAAFLPIAKSMVLDETEHTDVRAVCLNALTSMHRLNDAPLRDDAHFSSGIERLHNTTELPELKKMTSRFLENAARRSPQ